MYKNHCDIVNPGDNVIIGLGDSFTQGIGAYSLETWASMPTTPSLYNIAGQFFLDEQAKNNWVRQLANHHLPNYKVVNLGVNGAGNRATARELYLNPLPENLGNVIIVLMATGIERFDFLKQKDDTAGLDWHQKWQTIFPTISDRGPISRLEREYFEQIWSHRNDALEFLFTVKELQNFCKANGYKFLFSSAFDTSINKEDIEKALGDKKQHINIIDWEDYITIPNRKSFMDMVNQLENPYKSIHEIHAVHSKLKMPTKYITPCSHWTIEGNKVVADYIFEEIKKRNLI